MSGINSTAFGLDFTALPSYIPLEQLSPNFDNFVGMFHSFYPTMVSMTSSFVGSIQAIPQNLTWSMALNVVLFTLLAINLKCLPFVYHLRILNGLRHVLKSQRPPVVTPEHLFQPLITSSRAPLMEIDVYGHKNNNTYFTDHDIARTHLLSTMFSRGIENMRGSVVMNGLSGNKRSAFTIPLGAVVCSFRKELKPYEAYDMWTRILSWDEKWLYIVTHFVKKGAKIEPEEMTLYPRQKSLSSSSRTSRQSSVVSLDTPRGSVDHGSLKPSGSAIAASAMSKVVFKDGRITIAPEVMLEASGLLPPKPTKQHHEELANAQIDANVSEVGPTEAVAELEKVEGSDCASDSGYDSSRRGSSENVRQELTREAIEAERVRGLRLAKMLAGQVDLENELRNDVALGRHHDGHGIEGVVATLMQLGKLSSYQLL